jgi:hypothetical protein
LQTFRGDRRGARQAVYKTGDSRQVEYHAEFVLDGLVVRQSDEADAGAVAELAAKQGSLTADITRIAADTAAGVLAKLNDEQRAKLEAMGERHREKMAERKERRKARAGERAQEGPDENG